MGKVYFNLHSFKTKKKKKKYTVLNASSAHHN